MSAAESLPYVVDDEVEKAAKLAAQFPKVHACSGHFFGRILTFLDLEDFRARTVFHAKDEDRFCEMEHRHCECGSTLLVLTKIHDLAEE